MIRLLCRWKSVDVSSDRGCFFRKECSSGSLDEELCIRQEGV